jgi:hypothetical protein
VAAQSDLKKLIFDLAKISKENKTHLRRNMRKIATPTLGKVRTAAGWSTRIPGSTKLKTGFTRRFTGIRIETERSISPHARPYEHAGQPGTYRHPVFADSAKPRNTWTWVTAPARPYMYPSAVEDLPEIGGRMLDVLIDLANKNGFHPS